MWERIYKLLLNNELKNVWKKMAIFKFEVLFRYTPVGAEEYQVNPVRITSFLLEICTRDVPNIKEVSLFYVTSQ
jgi:hypothetical protein